MAKRKKGSKVRRESASNRFEARTPYRSGMHSGMPPEK
jgi:hypothetical protein